MSRIDSREAYAPSLRGLHSSRGHKAKRLKPQYRDREARAFEKLQKRMRELAAERGMVPAVN